MAVTQTENDVSVALAADVKQAKSGAKRLKLRTLLAKFGCAKRSDANTAQITQMLTEAGLAINPPIVRLGKDWEITPNDWVYLSFMATQVLTPAPLLPTWNADGWFDRISKLELRTEKEVEIKFIVPLLERLGYGDEDRYDGMPIRAAHGSKETTLVIDFALFNSAEESLRGQSLLTVEAKREGRLIKQREVVNAQNQAKSYCLWTQCDFFMVTDGLLVQVFHIRRGRLDALSPLFECERADLKDQFDKLYALASKQALTRYYISKTSTTEEAL